MARCSLRGETLADPAARRWPNGQELTVTPAGPQPVTIVYRIDNRRGKHVGANQHTEPTAAAAQAGR